MNIDAELRKLKTSVARLRASSEKVVSEVLFTITEQELIRRVVLAVYPQIRDKGDKSTAAAILEKTKWIGEERNV